MLRFRNQLAYKSDRDLISPSKISTLSSKRVMRILLKFCSQCIWDKMKKASRSCKESANTIQSFSMIYVKHFLEFFGIFSFFQDFSVTGRLREDKGKDKTLEAILRRQDT